MNTDEIKETKEKLQNIISLLDDVLSGKLTQGKAAETMGLTPQSFGEYIRKASFAPYIRKNQIFSEEMLADILKSVQTPCSAIVKDVIWPLDEESKDKVLLIKPEKEKLFLKLMKKILTEQEYLAINLRYGIDSGRIMDMTYDSIGKFLKLKRDRVRQIILRGLRKLRNPDYLYVLISEELLSTRDIEHIENVLPPRTDKMYDPVECLHIPCRCSNALKRSGCFTIDDLSKFTKEDLRKIRTIGASSVQEICTQAKALYGIDIK